MKKLSLLLLASIIFPCTHFAQPGFNQWFDFENAAAFHQIFYENDTLLIVGTIYNTEEERWGTVLVKMDTLGTIYDYSSYFDPNGGQQAFSVPYQASLSSDGNVLITGVLFFQEKYFIMKLSKNGEIILYNEYELLPNVLTVLPFKLIEAENGYYLFSNKQLSDFNPRAAITKLDYQGNILWEQFYAHPYDNAAFLTDVWQKDNNTFVIGSSFGNFDELNMENSWTKSWIFAVDSLGNLLWESVNDNESRVRGIQQLDNGDWVYGASSFYPSPYVSFDFYHKPKIVRRDSSFNLLWLYEMAHSHDADNATVDIAIAPDGHFVGIGHWVVPDEYVPGGIPIPDDQAFIGGCLYKIGNMGDSLWIQCDTGIVENAYTSSQKLGGMVVLPSGSIIAVGSFKVLDGNNRPVGWVMKRDKNGCMEELCVLTDLEELESGGIASTMKVYPNPASSQVRFEWQNNPWDNAYLHIRDVMGQSIYTTKIIASYQWDTVDVPNGIYIYQLQTKGKLLQTGRIVVQH